MSRVRIGLVLAAILSVLIAGTGCTDDGRGDSAAPSASSVAPSETLVIPTYIPPGHQVLVMDGGVSVQHIRMLGSTQVVITQERGLRAYEDTHPIVIGGRNLNAGNLVDPPDGQIFWWPEGPNTIVVTIVRLGSDPNYDPNAIIEGIQPGTEDEWQYFKARFAGSS